MIKNNGDIHPPLKVELNITLDLLLLKPTLLIRLSRLLLYNNVIIKALTTTTTTPINIVKIALLTQ